MAVYSYTARDEKGSEFSGTYTDINSVAMLREELNKIDYTLLNAKRKKAEVEKPVKIKPQQVVTFAYNFAGMCSAGLSIIRCLETLEEQTENQAFKQVLSDIRQKVERGSTLKNAFEKYRNVFSDFFLGMLDAGETGGKLSKTLEMSAAYLEKQADLRRKVKSAFAYPLVVGIVCLVVVTALVIFVVPVFSRIYRQMHVSLPTPTQALVDLSNLVRGQFGLVLICIAAVLLMSKVLSKKPYLKRVWDIFKLNMPLFGKLNRMVIVSRFIRTFAMLSSAGIPLVRAISVASTIVNNAKLSEIADQLQQSIEAGNPVAGALRNHGIFPPMVIQLAASGEEAGLLSGMLEKGADFLDKDIERTINTLLVKLEPTLTVIMGLIVGFILMAVYLPMFDYMSHLK